MFGFLVQYFICTPLLFWFLQKNKCHNWREDSQNRRATSRLRMYKIVNHIVVGKIVVDIFWFDILLTHRCSLRHNVCRSSTSHIQNTPHPTPTTATKKAPFRVLYFFTNLYKVLHMFRSSISMRTNRLMFGMLSKFSFCSSELVNS